MASTDRMRGRGIKFVVIKTIADDGHGGIAGTQSVVIDLKDINSEDELLRAFYRALNALTAQVERG